MWRLGLVTVLVGTMAGAMVGAAGCGGQGAPAGPAGAGDELVGRTFLSTSATEGGQARELVAGTSVSLWFAEDGRLVANAGCNTISGSVDPSGGKLTTDGDLAVTEMGCDAPRHAQDEWLARLLGAAPTWRLDGDELTITSPDAGLVLVDREVAAPDRPVEGTTWLLDTIVQGQAASSLPAGVSAHLTFADGQVTGSTGCNMLSGPATIAEGTITFGPLTMTRKACPDDLGSVEQAVVAVLQGEVPFTVESDRLTLNPGGPQSLGFHA